MNSRILLILTTLLSLCTSCRESDQERVARLVQEWQGKEIVFPEGLVFTRFVKDTVDYTGFRNRTTKCWSMSIRSAVPVASYN